MTMLYCSIMKTCKNKHTTKNSQNRKLTQNLHTVKMSQECKHKVAVELSEEKYNLNLNSRCISR